MPPQDTPERRSCAEFRVAHAGSKTPTIVGYAAVFNSISTDLGGFHEIVRPGAFSNDIKEKRDVLALFEHSRDQFLGRTKSGTLSLREDSRGLHFEITPPNTQAGTEVLELIERGDVDSASFSFHVRKGGEGASLQKDGTLLRELTDLALIDISPVFSAAYEATTVSAETRSRVEALLNGANEQTRTDSLTKDSPEYKAHIKQLETELEQRRK